MSNQTRTSVVSFSPDLSSEPRGADSVVFKVVSAAQARRERELVDHVVASLDGAKSERRRQVAESLIRHLHAFVREVRLTEEEWETGIDLLTAAGRSSHDDPREELILLSDVLGVSSQVLLVNDDLAGEATEATVAGPSPIGDSPEIPLGGDLSPGAVGEPCFVEGTVRDLEGSPVAGARIEVCESFADGQVAGCGHLFADEQGSYRFWALTPRPHPIPSAGPVASILEALGRSPMRASHLTFKVSGPEHQPLVTQIFVQGCEYLAADSAFSVQGSLVKEFAVQPAGTPVPDGRDLGEGTWRRTRFDVVLAPSKDEVNADACVLPVPEAFHA